MTHVTVNLISNQFMRELKLHADIKRTSVLKGNTPEEGASPILNNLWFRNICAHEDL